MKRKHALDQAVTDADLKLSVGIVLGQLPARKARARDEVVILVNSERRNRLQPAVDLGRVGKPLRIGMTPVLNGCRARCSDAPKTVRERTGIRSSRRIPLRPVLGSLLIPRVALHGTIRSIPGPERRSPPYATNFGHARNLGLAVPRKAPDSRTRNRLLLQKKNAPHRMKIWTKSREYTTSGQFHIPAKISDSSDCRPITGTYLLSLS